MVNCQGRIEWVQSGDIPPTRARLYREAGATSLKHAIIVTGGKQYRVAEGDVIFVEKLDVEAGETVKFDRVLAVIDEDKAVFGTPVVENAVVSGNVVKNGKSKKIRVYKMKPKKGYRRTQGHRQPYTKVEITKIEA
jgi:large subunit ribosomal protein L21